MFNLILETVDKSECRKITRINKVRNDYLHRKEKEPKHLFGREATKTYAPIVEAAITILKEKLDVYRVVVWKGWL